VVVFGSLDGKLYAVEPSGALRWKLDLGGGIESSPAVGIGGTIYVGCNDGKLYAIGEGK
jgi:outer membrane protein assembly factor BamB